MPQTNVGASLLAKAMCQSTYRLNVTPYSRAGSLPHWVLRCVRRNNRPRWCRSRWWSAPPLQRQ
ncbi:hypothetical protein EVS84_16265 [Pseudomonas koreensis]|uniref:Uncharacterized protein n=1 Tax=Pseudomonas koreensis TaxID=198620 RepID=A0A4Q4L3I0_9PSED|nr:hypothetical protein EVS84_16265 [Pseudomonas koreensis]